MAKENLEKIPGVRTFSLLVMLGALALGLLAACGQGAEPTPTPTTAAAVAAEPTPALAPQVTGVALVGVTPTPTPVGYQPVYGGILRWDLAPPTNPDPWHVSSGRQWPRMFYNGLIDIKMPFDTTKGIEYTPALAESWSQSADGSKWTLKLRQGVTFHDGEVFNADDVVATFERALEPSALIQPRLVAMRKIFTSAQKVDANTVLIDTSEPNASAFTYMASHFTMMMPEHLIRGDRNATDPKLRWKFLHPNATGTLGVGTGPFVMDKWQPDAEWTGKRNANYWRRDEQGNRLPYLDGVRFTQVTDQTRLLARFVAGEAHMTLAAGAGVHPIKANQLCQSTRDAGCYIVPFPHGFFEWFLNPLKVSQFGDSRVVQAARYASNHQTVMELAYGGRQGFIWMDRDRFPDTALALKEQYELVPWSKAQRRPEFEQKAKDLIIEAGYPGGIDLPLPIFGGCTGGFLDQFSREVDYFWRAGLRGTLECRQGIVSTDELKAGRWSLADTPASIYLVDPGLGVLSKLLLDSPAVGNAPWRWQGQDELDFSFRRLLREVDVAKRNEQYKAIERYMANDKLTAWSIGFTSVVAPVHGCLQNYTPGGVWDSHSFALEFAWLTKDCH